MNNNSQKYPIRYLAQIIFELSTPLSISTGDKVFETDSPVALDANGLPYIPGTAITGVIRSVLPLEMQDDIFGSDKGSGLGSRLFITEARILDSKEHVVDGYISAEFLSQDPVLSCYKALPIRQHVRINHRGVSDEEKRGKFDEQVVYAGSRFCCELEMLGVKEDENIFNKIVDAFAYPEFRLGGGSRKGFGSICIIDHQVTRIDMSTEKEKYLGKSAQLGSDFWSASHTPKVSVASTNWEAYNLELEADDFIFFGSGLGDDEVDMVVSKERMIKWDGQHFANYFLLPGTSIKGAISHRFCYHWNKLNGYTYGHPKASTGEQNPAVRSLFGAVDDTKQRGHVIISDVMIEEPKMKEYQNSHLSVDRFTGAALDGHLFFEKNVYAKGNTISLKVLVEKSALEDNTIKKAFELTLEDICNGLLPLGGAVNRGNGFFHSVNK